MAWRFLCHVAAAFLNVKAACSDASQTEQLSSSAVSEALPATELIFGLQEELRELREELHSLRGEVQALRGCCSQSKVDAEESSDGVKVEQEVASSSLLHVDFHDEAWVKEVFFGGQPWILHCLQGHTSVEQEVPDVLRESAFELRSMATFGTISCWERLPSSQKTLAQRFSLPKPPLTLAIANGDAPVPVDLASVVGAEELREKASPHLAAKITPIDGLAGFKAFCSKRKSCLVVGYRSAATLRAANRILAPLLEQRRGLRAVALDTSDWQLRLDERFAKQRPVIGSTRADLLCLSRGEAPPVPSNRRLAKASSEALSGVARHGQRGGAWMQGERLEESEAAAFLDRCQDGKDLTSLLDVPWIAHRKKGSPSPSPSPPTKASRKTKSKPSAKWRKKNSSQPDSGKKMDVDGYEFVEL